MRMGGAVRILAVTAPLLLACGRTPLPAAAPPDLGSGGLACPQVFDLFLTLYTRETIAWIDSVALRPDGDFAFAGGSSFAEPEAGYSFNFWSADVGAGGVLRWSGKDNWRPGRPPVLKQSARGVVVLDDGSTVVAGTHEDGLRLVRRDPMGRVTGTIAATGLVDEIFGVTRVAEGAVAVVGSHGDPRTGQTRAFVHAFSDFSGGPGLPWTTVDLMPGFASRGRAIAALDGGGVVVTGVAFRDSPTIGQPFLCVIDRNGDVKSQVTYPMSSDYGATAVIALPDGDLVFAGSVFGARRDAFLARTDRAGRFRWVRSYGGAEDDMAWGLARIGGDFPGGAGFAVAGQTSSKGAGDQDAWLIRTDENGELLFDRTYGHQYYDVAYDVAVIPASPSRAAGFLLGGSQSIPEQDERADAWLARTDASGIDHCGGTCRSAVKLLCADGAPCTDAVCDALTTCVNATQVLSCGGGI